MALRNGLAKQFGMKDEVTPGIPVTVDRFIPLVDESLALEIERLESEAVFPGRQVLDTLQWAPGEMAAGGDVGFELFDRAVGLPLKHCFGTVNTSGPVSSLYTHTFTPGDLSGIAFTAQRGVPDTGGTVRPFTYPGSKIASWEVACKEGENVTFGVTLLSKTEVGHLTVADGVTTNGSPTVTSATAGFSQAMIGWPISGTGIPANSYIGAVNSATSISLSSTPLANTPVNATATGSALALTIGIALAAASMPAGIIPMQYRYASLTLAGSTQKVMAASIKGDNKLEERRFLGQGTTDEPFAEDRREYTGELECEFESVTAYNRFVNGAEAALVLAFATPGGRSLTFTCNVRFDGASPESSGRKRSTLKLPFKCIGSTDAAAITAVFVTGDSTP
jgi:hypothetical protein